eukprot:INCI17938.1.p1 GENE.INCI17938.1~~INCI17938.1.p1  ORF type:complete len:428 (+),score=61.02 INCI17938.1:269-1552(+)
MADPTPQLENRPWGLSPNTAAWVDEVIQSDAVVLQLQQVVDSIERALEDDFDRLLEVCQTDNLDEFEAVVHRSEFHTRLVNQPMPGGATPLWVATCSGSTKCVLALLDTKANPFEAGASASGFSPLHVACELGNTTIVSALLAGAPKAGTTTDSGQTAQALVNEMSGSSNTFPLYNAAKSGHLDIVRMLIAAGARINCLVLPEGATALHAAREGGHSQVVEALLTAGAEDFSPTPAEWTHVDPDSGESEELEYAGSDGNEFSRGVEASTLDYTISPGRVGRRHSMPEVRVAATSAEGGGGGAMTSDSDDLDAIPRSRVRRSTIGASFQTSTARRTRSLKKASGRRKIRARTRSGLYGCGSREQVHVIQQQTLRKRINWSADFHDRFFSAPACRGAEWRRRWDCTQGNCNRCPANARGSPFFHRVLSR